MLQSYCETTRLIMLLTLLKLSPHKQRYWFVKTRPKAKIPPCLIPVLAIVLFFGYRQLESEFAQPQAVVVLGGAEARERYAAEFVRQHPNLEIWVSGGSPEGYVKRIFAKSGINGRRLHLDYQAGDTVTNFTTLVDQLQAQGIDSVYLITSDYHMRRARIIGEIVFGSRGIILKPVVVPSVPSKLRPGESSLKKCLRDGTRSVLWVLTGYTGEKRN